MHFAPGDDVINIPIKGGITEGGLIIIGITLTIITILIFAILYGKRIAGWIKQIRDDTAETKESTVNSHGPNLRNDIDNKHDQVREDIRLLFENTAKRFDTLNDRITGIDTRIGNVENRMNQTTRY